MVERDPAPPDFRTFHQSIAQEMHAVKNRIRNLIQDRHWLSDGEFKETVLRTVIRRHVPNSAVVGRGFIVNSRDASTQCDVLIVEGNAPVLFREGDLLIVTPDAVRAVIEVKTRVGVNKFGEALRKLARVAEMCNGRRGNRVWSGLFVFESQWADHASALRAISHAQQESGGVVSCVSWGKTLFMRQWDADARIPQSMDRPFWRSYDLDDLAPSYFVGNLMAALAGRRRHTHEYAWFPEIGGKEAHRRYQVAVGSQEPEECHP